MDGAALDTLPRARLVFMAEPHVEARRAQARNAPRYAPRSYVKRKRYG